MKRCIILIICLETICLIGCVRKQTTEPAARIIPVKVMDVGFSEHSYIQNYVGTVEETNAISLSFSGMGTVERVLASEGERVRKGQLLAVLNSESAQNAYDVAKQTLYQAQDAYDRLKPLHEKGSVTDIKWVELETGFEKAQSMEAIAKKSLEDCSLYAPVSGIIAKRSVEVGVNVMPGLPVFKLILIDDIFINVSIPENEIGIIKTGQPATIMVPALGNRKYKGKVENKGVEANPVSHTYTVKIGTANPQSELMPGMVCKVSLQNDEDQKIIIPNKCVQIAPDNTKFVWIAQGNTATRRFISVGSLSEYGVIVENGLSDGDKLIVEGSNKISEGMRISIVH